MPEIGTLTLKESKATINIKAAVPKVFMVKPNALVI